VESNSTLTVRSEDISSLIRTTARLPVPASMKIAYSIDSGEGSVSLVKSFCENTGDHYWREIHRDILDARSVPRAEQHDLSI
jgi:predicted secreted protein